MVFRHSILISAMLAVLLSLNLTPAPLASMAPENATTIYSMCTSGLYRYIPSWDNFALSQNQIPDVTDSRPATFASGGTYQWHTFYGSLAGDEGCGIAVDTLGNLYITGASTLSWNGPQGQPPLHPPSGGFDIVVLKLDANGAYQWHTFFGSSDMNEMGISIALDGRGGVVISGASFASWMGPENQQPLHNFSGFLDITVLKLDTSGKYQWHTFYGGPDSDFGHALAVDAADNIYLTAMTTSSWTGPEGQAPLHAYSGYLDTAVLKLGPSGAYQWHTFYGSTSIDFGYGLALDGSGGVYISGVGYSPWTGPSGQPPLHDHSGWGNADITVLKLDTAGAYQWHTFYGSLDIDEGYGLTADRAGGIYLTAYSAGPWDGPQDQTPLHPHSLSPDIAVLKLNSSGSYQWHTFYGATKMDDYGYGIIYDGHEGVYIIGHSLSSWTGPTGQAPLHDHSDSANTDITVLKLATSGAYQWHTFYGSTTGDEAYTAAIDDRGSLAVVGISEGTWNGPFWLPPLHTHSGLEEITVLKFMPTIFHIFAPLTLK